MHRREGAPVSVDRYIQVSIDLDKIADMAARLHARALDRSDDSLMPGGEAMVAMGPAADLAAWTDRLDRAEQIAGPGRVDTEHELPDEMWPALQTLRYWSDDVRYRLGMDHEPPWRPTLVSEATFLRNRDVAMWIFDNEPRWDDYAADVRTAKAKLETILHEGTRSETSRVDCPCGDTRAMVLIWAKRYPIAWDCDTCGEVGVTDLEPHVEHEHREAAWESDDDDDRWLCKGCRTRRTREQIEKMAVDQMRHAPDKYKPLPDALHILAGVGWRKATVRGWLGPLDHRKDDRCDRCRTEHEPDAYAECPWCGHELRRRFKKWDREAVVEAYCDVKTRRTMIHWPSLWRRHLMERQAKIVAARKAADRAAGDERASA